MVIKVANFSRGKGICEFYRHMHACILCIVYSLIFQSNYGNWKERNRVKRQKRLQHLPKSESHKNVSIKQMELEMLHMVLY